MMRTYFSRLLHASWLLLVATGACSAEPLGTRGVCTKDGAIQCAANFDGYSCKGSVRPDDNGTFNGNVPVGLVCNDLGSLINGDANYCCTNATTSCAYDSSAVCVLPEGAIGRIYGYACLGTNRPDSYDPQLHCGQGLRTQNLIVYCCGGLAPPGSCTTASSIPCTVYKGDTPMTAMASSGKMSTKGFHCAGGYVPNQSDLGVNQSRSETPLMCSLPVPNSGGGNDYCCYAAVATPPGSSCLQDQAVTGCTQAGAFGFSCLGIDTPDQDYPPMKCQPGVKGRDPQGYPATLYCCVYES